MDVSSPIGGAALGAAAVAHIGALDKGLGALSAELPAPHGSALEANWDLLREDLSLPVAVLYESRLSHNLRWMQAFAQAYGMKLAPHGKTTMAPALFRRQLAAGAWGITLATAHQALVAHAHGVKRVLLANQLVGRRNLEIVAELLQDQAFELYCLVDSAEGVEQLGRFFAARDQSLSVLLEVGVNGGRTGVRDDGQCASTCGALERWKHSLKLAGVELFEGILDDEGEIRTLLRRAVKAARELAAANAFQRAPVILSGAGSAWYDVVAEEFARADIGAPVEVVLRPGCYLTHDVGPYRTAQARIEAHNSVAHAQRPGLQSALQLWAYVHSVPEPERAIIGFGKRDAAFDAGFPEPASQFRPGSSGRPSASPAHWKITRMMDQHSYLQIAAGDDVRVGDMLAFDLSHPCLTFDKWRAIPILSEDFRVTEIVKTYF